MGWWVFKQKSLKEPISFLEIAHRLTGMAATSTKVDRFPQLGRSLKQQLSPQWKGWTPFFA